ncbi:voltage-gated chloride channel/CBS domain-containing protein [Burkholderia pseudomallei]|uniref:chloride channel protein n=1 Tax=Burkholderia pseudomallei TaxID=28450 RepID=UPI000975C197|nr:chloride channel protein [Burkholderia pseudomallei]OMS01037.1 chloride channel protein [Burkholderia pseudomallei]CAJ3175620.1 voltage-gated chloride channel/CBS domain-containing protein [Burkholderia pseudomallei]CAJ3218855.1 voltage-gated chloride channel/CBS domain-containing protein [Burkholderia pseudomallei]CAJ3881293.1 voltage-gated chloride channel/CBS domain-containing protein [Burkholderia pseudomallei]CAJ3886740.1 voltage-gated chloride channel/CBS domain-containing protein [Bu
MSIAAPHKRDFASNARLPRIALLALAIGVLGTFAAFALLSLIHLFTNLFFFQRFSFAEHSPALNTLGPWAAAVPVAGGIVVGLIARFGSEKIRGHGIPEAIEAILFGKSRMSPKVAVLKPLASGIVIGSGGPFGAEGPIIMTGGAIGSLIAQFVKVTAAERKTLLVAGATAGMTAVFGTPVAAVLLAVELLLFEWRPRSFLPVALACAVAGFARAAFFGVGPLFPVETAAPTAAALGSCALAGLLSGALACGLSVSLYKIEDRFGKLPVHWMWWPAIGGLAVGIGGLIEPRALGVGYDVIGDLLHGHIALQIALAILVVKAVIWVIALGSGTSGGVLAPLLMLGAGLGTLLGPVLPGGEPALWPLVCMAATLGATLGAPLTAIVFAFGLTHDANALLPLLTATLVAHGFATVAMKRSIMTEKIARRGYHIYREYGVDPLERHYVDEVMTRSAVTIDADLSVEVVRARYFGATQAHRAYPVVRDGVLIGMLDRAMLDGSPAAHDGDGQADDARAAKMRAADVQMIDMRVADVRVADVRVADVLPRRAPLFSLADETCRLVATRLAVHQLERLPVVADPDTMRVVGIVSRSDLVKPALRHFDDEHKRERFRRAHPAAFVKRRFAPARKTG